MSEDSPVQVSEEMEKFITYVESMTVLELSNLIKALEDRLGVTAAAPAAVAVAGAAAPAAAEEEKTEFDVILVGIGDQKIKVIKEVKAITGLGLKDAKALVDSFPKPIKEAVSKEESEKLKEQLQAVGATIEVK